MHVASFRHSWLVAAALSICSAGSGEATEERYEFAQVHMGLPIRLVLHARSEPRARDAAAAAFERIETLEQIFSDFRADSEVRQLAARHGQWVPVSAELFAVVSRAVEIARLTGGAFDPTVGPLVVLWREARQTGQLPSPSAIETARSRVGWRLIELDPAHRTLRLRIADMRVDLGGIAKGYILEAAIRTLAARDVTRALIEAGGDIVVNEAPPGRAGWRIELPPTPELDRAFAHRAANLERSALATSGPTFQAVEIGGVRYSHVIDPRRGIGLTHDLVARVIAPDGATADALATALTVAGRDGADTILDRFPGVMASLSSK